MFIRARGLAGHCVKKKVVSAMTEDVLPDGAFNIGRCEEAVLLFIFAVMAHGTAA